MYQFKKKYYKKVIHVAGKEAQKQRLRVKELKVIELLEIYTEHTLY